jgi:pyridoxal phosphate enzyme (YggS family)
VSPATGGGAVDDLPTVEAIRDRLAEIRTRIEALAGGRDVGIVGVTKTFPPALTERALSAGLTMLGENYAQDLVVKADAATAQGLSPNWHFIGGLQRNKVKLLVGRVAVWETIDRAKLLNEIANRSVDPTGERVFIQVNTTGEEQKSGCRPDEAARLVEHGRSLGLRIEGLMTIGPTGGQEPRPAFEQLVALADRLELPDRSMGMSGDYELAVEVGSTIVRIGSSLFGPRRS